MLLALLFRIGDIDAALKTPTGFPFIEIFTQATNSMGGGTAMVYPSNTSPILTQHQTELL